MTQPIRPTATRPTPLPALHLPALPLLALLLLALTPLVQRAPAQARTILNPQALDALTASGLPLPPPPPPGAPPPGAPPLGPPAPEAATPPATPHGSTPSPLAAPPASAPLPTLGTAPAKPEIPPPPIEVPTRPPAPAGPSHVVDTATGDATSLAVPKETGLRLTFGATDDDLNPASAATLRDFASAAPPGTVFTVSAFAAGAPDDPSTPRRLSLSRALAVRGVLLGAGVASPQVIVRSLGASMPAIADGPPDRVDVTYPNAGK